MLKLTRIAAVALIGLAVLLAVIALMIGRKQAAPATVAPVAQSEVQAITVVEAVARLPAGEPISANGVRLAQRTTAVAGAATSISAVVGKVPVQDIAEGTAISSGALAQGFSLQLRPGERALAVPVDELVGAGTASCRVISSMSSSTCAMPSPTPAVRQRPRRLACCCRGCACSATVNRTSLRSPAMPSPATKVIPATIPAPPTSPAMATTMARATRPPSRHAVRYWQCRWPMPTGCCWVRSREAVPCPAQPGRYGATRPCTVPTGAWRDRSRAWPRCRTAARTAAAGEPRLRRHRW